MKNLKVEAIKNNKKAIKAGRCPSCNNKLIPSEKLEKRCWNCGIGWDGDGFILGTYDLDNK